MISKIQTFRLKLMAISLGLVSLLTACPYPPAPPFPVIQVFQSDLVNQTGSTITAKVDATLGKNILTFAGDVKNATASDVFTASVTCDQTQNLTIGVSNGVPITIFGNFDITLADRVVLNNQQCAISVFNTNTTLILKGFLRSRN